MKKNTGKIASLMMFLILLQACDKKEELVNKPTLYVKTSGFSEVSTYGNTLEVEFLSNMDWSVSSNADWISFPDGTTGSQSGTFKALVSRNESGEERSATITMIAGDITKTILVEQQYRDTATPQLTITTQGPINVDYQNNSKSIAFICNMQWTASSDADWITFDGANSGLEDGTVKISIANNEGTSSRTGTVSITAGTLTRTIQVVQKTEADGGINLLDTPEEDYSFELITTNQSWPPRGEWGGSATSGIGRFGGSGTAVRVVAGVSPVIRTGKSYLFVRMRANETTTSVDWFWRKLSGLTSGKSYTFSFWYKTPANNASFVQTGNIRLGAVQNVADVASLTNPLNGEITFGHTEASGGTPSSVDEFKQVSYTFTVPAGKTEVYISWVRNGNQQPYIDDMSLVMNR
ncbi:BACON domain-containing protein [Pseudopedobacter beijingensis]|uniref:BACON domain-containing protein n=1 Tax=Pseudopedobacter beijingensis TaxID=1207056 RepID=A0ABW4I7N5_9SPHI